MPREFREEVKKRFLKKDALDSFSTECTVLCRYFGKHNLYASDAEEEEEEMLHVSRKKVQKAYKECDRYFCFEGMLDDLFGSKCLPDEEPQPAEPKFKRGDMVIFKPTGKKKVVFDTDKWGRYMVALPNMQSPLWVDESDLELYTEPQTRKTASQPSESVKNSQNQPSESENRVSDHIPDPAKMVDAIIKDGSRNERRLNIAVQMVKALTQSSEIVDRISSACDDSLLDGILHDALYLTDKLIAECEASHKKHK